MARGESSSAVREDKAYKWKKKCDTPVEARVPGSSWYCGPAVLLRVSFFQPLLLKTRILTLLPDQF